MRFRREITDGDVQIEPSQITTALLQHRAGLYDSNNIGIRFTGQSDHEIELHFPIAVLHRNTDAFQKIVIG